MSITLGITLGIMISDMPHYENEAPFELPENWEWTTINDICSKIGSGSTPRGSNYAEIGIPFFRSQNVYNDGLVYDDIKYISDEVHESMIGTEVQAEDLLLNITGGSLGRCAIVPSDFPKGNVSQHVCILRTIVVLPAYLHLFIISDYFSSTMILSGSGREGLPKYSLEIMQFPLPPLTEQHRIVAAVEKWFSLIDKLETEKEDLQTSITQAKSKILELAIHGKLVPQDLNDEPAIDLLKRINPKFTPCDNAQYPYEVPDSWGWCKLIELCSFLSRGKSPTYSEEEIYPVFAQKCNLFGGGISLEQARFLDPNTLHKWPEEYKLRDGDVLVNSTGTGTVGRTRLFNSVCLGDYPFVVPDSHVSVVRTFDPIDSDYIYSVMSSRYGQEYIEDNLAGSTNQKELYIGVLENMLIPLPPDKEQKRISIKIKELFTVLDEIKESLEVK